MYLENNIINTNYRLSNDFYNLIARHRQLMVRTHSIKLNEILYSGVAIVKEIRENSNILDIGCNSGYLTSFYAKEFPKSYFIGLDKSKDSILQALKISNLKKYSNLCFSYNLDILNKYKFDIICDTQCFNTLKKADLIVMLDLLKDSLHANIKIISVSNLRNEQEADIFLKVFNKKKLFVQSLTPLFIKSLNGIVVLTKIIFTKKKIETNYDLNTYFMNLRKKISVVNLFKLNQNLVEVSMSDDNRWTDKIDNEILELI